MFKQHRLLHYPTVLEKSGPFIHQCVLKYERKHQFFKRLAHIVCNFKNICKTMLDRHQLQQYVYWSSPKDLKGLEFGPGKFVSTRVAFHEKSLTVFKMRLGFNLEWIYECKRALRCGVWFRCQDAVFASYNCETDEPNFLKIEKILNIFDELYFFGSYLKTSNFSEQSRSFLVSETSNIDLLNFNSIFDYHCYSIHRCFDQNCLFGHVVLRNKIAYNNFPSCVKNNKIS